jgi:hypothetical protein
VSWHYLQGQEVASWAESCLDGAPSALLKLMPIAGESSWPDSATDICHDFQYGTTLRRLTPRPGPALQMWLPAGFRVKTFQTLDHVGALRASTRDYGLKCSEWFAAFSRDTCSWRTAQRCLLEGWAEWSATWPQTGMTVNGNASRLPPSVPRTYERESGFWPTPVASEGKRRSRHRYAQGGWSLTAVLGGGPNPAWAEWLMGWPTGWTDLRPLATAKFQQWLRLHGACSGKGL